MSREHTLVRRIEVGRPIDEVFAFFADATNLELITPPELWFRIDTPLPITMREGTRIDYRLRLWGVPVRWRTLISRWEPPFGFVDVQERGPYAQWIHTHRFVESDTGTVMTDEVRYRLPLSWAGSLGHPLVRNQLGRIFDYRELVTTRELASPAVSAAAS